jgi:iron complex outermembrane receptor protein
MRKVFSCVVAAISCLIDAAALADSPADDSTATGAIEEIVVTAQKRAENLERTPIAITAFTAATIARTGVSNLADLAEKAPNVTFKFTAPISGASNAATVFIRGIGQSDFALTTDAGVGTYVDGVYLSRSVGGVLDVLDLERVEILRGPQGTLFGRNTIGGAISLLTKRPSFGETSGSVQLTGGSRNQLYLRGDLNVPLADTLAIRVAASSKNRDGYVNTAFTPASPYYRSALTNLGNEDRQAVRTDILWKPNSDLDVSFSSDYSRVRENNAPAVLVGVTGTTSPADGPIAFLYNAFEAPGTTLPGFPNGQYSAANFVTGSKDKTYATGPNGTRLDAYGGAITLDYHLVPDIALKSITAYHRESGTFARDADGSPITLTDNIDTDYSHQQFSQELQLTGAAFADRIKYATGIYYYRETGSDPLIVVFPASFGLLNISEDRVRNTSYAAYGQGSVDVTDELTLTAGLRYTKDHKQFLTNQTLTITGPGGTAATGAPPGTVVPLVPPNSDVSQDFSNTSPRVALDYKVTPQALLYASYTRGFKSGGFNLRYVVPRAAVRSFGPEKAEVIEVGTKIENPSRTLQLNVAAFSTRYQNLQLTYFESFGAPVTANGGDARIKGFDLELKARPIANLNVSVSAGYLNAYYTSLAAGLNAGATTPEQFITLNNRLPNTPKWQPAFDIDYTVPVPANRKLMFAVSGRHSSLLYNDAQNSRFLRQAAYSIFDASTTLSSAGEAWSLRAYVDNLTDKRYIVSGDSNFGIGFHEAEFNRPREYGAGITYRF